MTRRTDPLQFNMSPREITTCTNSHSARIGRDTFPAKQNFKIYCFLCRFFPSNEPTRSDDSDNNESLDDFCSSCVSSTVSIHMLFEQESSSSFVSLNEITRSKSFCCLTASLSNVSLLKSKLHTFVLFCVLTFLVCFSFKVAWTAESFAPEEGLLYYQRRHSFSGFQRSSSLQSLTGLRRDVRLCRSLSSLSRVSGGDVLRY